jgi:RNA polymerase sigma-70 factor, ECF subfamily
MRRTSGGRAEPRGDVRSPRAFLITVVTRLCLDALGSARARRETYVGPWLPEPLLVDELGPAGASELSDSLSLVFLVVLEELSALERAAFLLHDVFGYGYGELSTALVRDQVACRQLVARARKHVAARAGRFEADQGRAHDLTKQFPRQTSMGSPGCSPSSEAERSQPSSSTSPTALSTP